MLEGKEYKSECMIPLHLYYICIENVQQMHRKTRKEIRVKISRYIISFLILFYIINIFLQ